MRFLVKQNTQNVGQQIHRFKVTFEQLNSPQSHFIFFTNRFSLGILTHLQKYPNNLKIFILTVPKKSKKTFKIFAYYWNQFQFMSILVEIVLGFTRYKKC